MYRIGKIEDAFTQDGLGYFFSGEDAEKHLALLDESMRFEAELLWNVMLYERSNKPSVPMRRKRPSLDFDVAYFIEDMKEQEEIKEKILEVCNQYEQYTSVVKETPHGIQIRITGGY